MLGSVSTLADLPIRIKISSIIGNFGTLTLKASIGTFIQLIEAVVIFTVSYFLIKITAIHLTTKENIY